MSSRTTSVRLFLLIAISVGLANPADAQVAITKFTIDGGGDTRATGGAFALGGTIGQPDAGLLAGSGFSILGGFWSGGLAVTGVDDGNGFDSPAVFRLDRASPNPMLSQARVAFELPRASRARLALYDAAGRLVRVLADGVLAPGRHTQLWDRRDQSGRPVSPGIYFLRLDAGPDQGHQKLVVIH